MLRFFMFHLSLLLIIGLLYPSIAYADVDDCSSLGYAVQSNPNPLILSVHTNRIVTITVSGPLNPNDEYYVSLVSGQPWDTESNRQMPIGGEIQVSATIPGFNLIGFNYDMELKSASGGFVCNIGKLDVVRNEPNDPDQACSISIINPINPNKDTPFDVEATNLVAGQAYILSVDKDGKNDNFDFNPAGDTYTKNITATGKSGWYTFIIYKNGVTNKKLCELKRYIPEISDPNATPAPPIQHKFDICKMSVDDDLDSCGDCYAKKGIWTAVGCLPLSPTEAIIDLIIIAVGVAGGFSLLQMLIGILTIAFSTGVPDKIQEGKERILSALSGLLLILFSAILLQLVGVTIFSIPAF